MDTVSAIIEGMDRVYRIAPEILVLCAVQVACVLAGIGCIIWGAFNHRRIRRAITELNSARGAAMAAVDTMQASQDRLLALRALVHEEAARVGIDLPDHPVVH